MATHLLNPDGAELEQVGLNQNIKKIKNTGTKHRTNGRGMRPSLRQWKGGRGIFDVIEIWSFLRKRSYPLISKGDTEESRRVD